MRSPELVASSLLRQSEDADAQRRQREWGDCFGFGGDWIDGWEVRVGFQPLVSCPLDAGGVFSTVPATDLLFSGDSGTTWSLSATDNVIFNIEGSVVLEPVSGFLLIGSPLPLLDVFQWLMTPENMTRRMDRHGSSQRARTTKASGPARQCV